VHRKRKGKNSKKTYMYRMQQKVYPNIFLAVCSVTAWKFKAKFSRRLKFQVIALKMLKNLRGKLYFATPCTLICIGKHTHATLFFTFYFYLLFSLFSFQL